jgi:Cof subfamily protein (haloacid dehalogenase superfamily)
MLRFHRQLDLEGPIISCQGALTRNAETDEILHKHLMDADLAAEIIVDGEACGITQMVYQLDATYTRERTRYTDMYEFRTASVTEKIGDLTRFVGEQPQKIIWVCDEQDAARMLPQYQARYAGRLETLISDPEYLEFMAHGVSKAVGLAAVAAYYGVEQAHTLAFGDGNNDVTMIRWAGLGTAMDHARPSAIAAADFVAPPGEPETSFARSVASLLM